MARITKLIYSFGHGRAEGRTDQKQLLGGKGAGLAEITDYIRGEVERRRQGGALDPPGH